MRLLGQFVFVVSQFVIRVPCPSHGRESPIPVAMTASEFKRPVGQSRRATGELAVRPKLFLSCCGTCVSLQPVTVALVFYVWLKKIAHITISTDIDMDVDVDVDMDRDRDKDGTWTGTWTLT